MIYLLGYRREGDDTGYKVRLLLHTWKKSRPELPPPNILIVPPDEVDEFKQAAEKSNLTIVPDQEFKIRHGARHFALDYRENLKK